jgi:hypothetical protein
MSPAPNTEVAGLVGRSRAQQGLPATITDAAVLRRVAAIFVTRDKALPKGGPVDNIMSPTTATTTTPPTGGRHA